MRRIEPSQRLLGIQADRDGRGAEDAAARRHRPSGHEPDAQSGDGQPREPLVDEEDRFPAPNVRVVGRKRAALVVPWAEDQVVVDPVAYCAVQRQESDQSGKQDNARSHEHTGRPKPRQQWGALAPHEVGSDEDRCDRDDLERVLGHQDREHEEDRGEGDDGGGGTPLQRHAQEDEHVAQAHPAVRHRHGSHHERRGQHGGDVHHPSAGGGPHQQQVQPDHEQRRPQQHQRRVLAPVAVLEQREPDRRPQRIVEETVHRQVVPPGEVPACQQVGADNAVAAVKADDGPDTAGHAGRQQEHRRRPGEHGEDVPLDLQRRPARQLAEHDDRDHEDRRDRDPQRQPRPPTDLSSSVDRRSAQGEQVHGDHTRHCGPDRVDARERLRANPTSDQDEGDGGHQGDVPDPRRQSLPGDVLRETGAGRRACNRQERRGRNDTQSQ